MELILRSGLSKARTYHFDSVAIVEGLEGCWWENGEAVVEFRGIVRDVRSRSSTLQAKPRRVLASVSHQNASTPVAHQLSKPFWSTKARTKFFPSGINGMILPRTN